MSQHKTDLDSNCFHKPENGACVCLGVGWGVKKDAIVLKRHSFPIIPKNTMVLFMLGAGT